jgi:hypothetical protein
LVLSSNCTEGGMSELEMKNEAETEEFADDLSDESLDREEGGKFSGAGAFCGGVSRCRAGN